MAQYTVTVDKLNKRNSVPASFADKASIVGTVNKDYSFNGQEVLIVPNTALGKWVKGDDGYYYWGGGLLGAAEIARMAVQQNQVELLQKFPNILCISDAVKDLDFLDSHVVAIYLSDDNDNGLPASLTVTVLGKGPITIATEIIKNVGSAVIHNAVSDSNSPNYEGSICCLVTRDSDNMIGFVTSGHIFSAGVFYNYNAVFSDADTRDVLVDGNVAGSWFFQTINGRQDLAIVKINDTINTPSCKSFSSGYYQVTDNDVKSETGCVNIISKRGQLPDAYVIDYNVAFNVTYQGGIVRLIQGIILIGSTNQRDSSVTVTQGGDSGSCVVHKSSGKLVGMILGGNDKYSFVLPVQFTLNSLALKLI